MLKFRAYLHNQINEDINVYLEYLDLMPEAVLFEGRVFLPNITSVQPIENNGDVQIIICNYYECNFQDVAEAIRISDKRVSAVSPLPPSS